jgi:hypothetical protein
MPANSAPIAFLMRENLCFARTYTSLQSMQKLEISSVARVAVLGPVSFA